MDKDQLCAMRDRLFCDAVLSREEDSRYQRLLERFGANTFGSDDSKEIREDDDEGGGYRRLFELVDRSQFADHIEKVLDGFLDSHETDISLSVFKAKRILKFLSIAQQGKLRGIVKEVGKPQPILRVNYELDLSERSNQSIDEKQDSILNKFAESRELSKVSNKSRSSSNLNISESDDKKVPKKIKNSVKISSRERQSLSDKESSNMPSPLKLSKSPSKSILKRGNSNVNDKSVIDSQSGSPRCKSKRSVRINSKEQFRLFDPIHQDSSSAHRNSSSSARNKSSASSKRESESLDRSTQNSRGNRTNLNPDNSVVIPRTRRNSVPFGSHASQSFTSIEMIPEPLTEAEALSDEHIERVQEYLDRAVRNRVALSTTWLGSKLNYSRFYLVLDSTYRGWQRCGIDFDAQNMLVYRRCL
jgi:hypothetical protein